MTPTEKENQPTERKEFCNLVDETIANLVAIEVLEGFPKDLSRTLRSICQRLESCFEHAKPKGGLENRITPPHPDISVSLENVRKLRRMVEQFDDEALGISQETVPWLKRSLDEAIDGLSSLLKDEKSTKESGDELHP